MVRICHDFHIVNENDIVYALYFDIRQFLKALTSTIRNSWRLIVVFDSATVSFTMLLDILNLQRSRGVHELVFSLELQLLHVVKWSIMVVLLLNHLRRKDDVM